MLTINASYGLKEGRPGYGSESALCSVAMEVSETLSANELQSKIHSAFSIVRQQVKAELNGENVESGPIDPGSNEVPVHKGGGHKHSDRATNKQIAYACALAEDQGIKISELNKKAGLLYGVTSLYELRKADATKLIDSLKNHVRKAA